MFRKSRVTSDEKVCPRCKKSQPRSDYQKRAADKETGFVNIYSTCKSCTKEKNMLRKYGMTLKQWEEMLEEQNGVCKICFESPNYTSQYYVDHNHETGKVRGIICARCNFALGHSRDRIDILINMINYLERDGDI